MAHFIGRSAELKVLNEAYSSDSSAFIPIYGRRRVGKSELILHFLKGKLGLYFLGKKGTPQLQINEFLSQAARVLRQPILAGLSTTDWKTAIQMFTEAWKGDKKNRLGVRRVSMDRPGKSRASLSASGTVGSQLERPGRYCVDSLRFIHGIHGERGARQREPSFRTADGSDSTEALSLS